MTNPVDNASEKNSFHVVRERWDRLESDAEWRGIEHWEVFELLGEVIKALSDGHTHVFDQYGYCECGVDDCD